MLVVWCDDVDDGSGDNGVEVLMVVMWCDVVVCCDVDGVVGLYGGVVVVW